MNFDFDKIIGTVKDACKAAGVTEYEVIYGSEESISCETLKDEISSFSCDTSGSLSFRCISGGKIGSATSRLINDEEIAELVRRSVSNAEAIETEDEAVIFPGSEKYATLEPEYELRSAAELKNTALALQRKVYAESNEVADGTQSYAVSFVSETHMYNSYGLRLDNVVSNSYCGASAVLNNGKESVENYESFRGIDADRCAEYAHKTVCGAAEKFGASSVPTGKYNVVFDAKCMRQLLSAFSSVFSAKNAMLGLSLLAGKEGEKIASDVVTVTDDAMRDGCALKTPFDGEGVATYRKEVIKNGVLNTLLYDIATAKKAGKTTTANGHRSGGSISIAPYCFCIEPGENTLEELFSASNNGIYITYMKGLHAGANASTGDFSIDCEGFKIDGDKKGRPIKSFTVAGNFYELLKSVKALSDTVELPASGGFVCYGSPAVLVADMSIAGE